MIIIISTMTRIIAQKIWYCTRLKKTQNDNKFNLYLGLPSVNTLIIVGEI